MKHFTDGRDLSNTIWSELNLQNMLETLDCFSKLHRYSGKPQGEQAVDYLVNKLKEYDVDYQRLQYEGYFSRPIFAQIKVFSPEEMVIPAIASCYSGNVESLKAELYYDYMGGQVVHGSSPINKGSVNQFAERVSAFKDKIILTQDGSMELVMSASKSGALGRIQMWPSGEDLIHHTNIGAVWGTPTPDDLHLLTWLPSVCIKKADGERLIEFCNQGRVEIELTTQIESVVSNSSMPVAYIPGATDKYVLLAGHYDSWYEGITDNAAANAIMLELARVFRNHQPELKHGIRIAWWSGHSDGHYSGSTWYCDNHWEDINKNCVAYIYLDICGGKNTDIITPRGTFMEGTDMMFDLIERLTGRRPEEYVPMTKSGDMSFWGPGIPLIMYALNEPLPENRSGFSGLGGGPWWHTSADSMDKLDNNILIRDAKFNAYLAAIIANSKRLPIKLSYFISQMEGYLEDVDKNTVEEFDLSEAKSHFKQLKESVLKLETVINKYPDDDLVNDILIKTAGDIMRIPYSSTDPYNFEPSYYPAKSLPFEAMRKAIGVNRNNTPVEIFLLIKTSFIRLQNRTVGEINRLLDQIDYQTRMLS